MIKQYKKNAFTLFTLIEVVIALAILAMGLVTAMAMSSASKNRIDKARNNWKKQHMLSQAAEYFLLTGDENIPENFFPFDGFRTELDIEESEELPDDVSAELGNWRLVVFKIRIISESNGETLKSVNVEKIVKNE